MCRSTLRILLTILLYAGLAIFLVPYLTGHVSSGIIFLAVGITLAVVCGVLRCCLTEGDCPDRMLAESTRTTKTAPQVAPHR